MKLTPKNLADYLELDHTSKTGLRWRKTPGDIPESEKLDFRINYAGNVAGNEVILAGPRSKYYLKVNDKKCDVTLIINRLIGFRDSRKWKEESMKQTPRTDAVAKNRHLLDPLVMLAKELEIENEMLKTKLKKQDEN